MLFQGLRLENEYELNQMRVHLIKTRGAEHVQRTACVHSCFSPFSYAASQAYIHYLLCGQSQA